MKPTILVTGSEGLIGSALRNVLVDRGYDVRPFDVAIAPGESGHGDVRDRSMVERALRACVGVVHLAAVSRVVWGEQDPDRCWQTNAVGSDNVVSGAKTAGGPWVVLASSREVYGQPAHLPVRESCPLAPINVYGRSKAHAERSMSHAQAQGLRSCIVRFSNVYGSPGDHLDRVIPAFSRAAVLGEELRVEGAERTFDFTHVEDAVCGLWKVIERLDGGQTSLPPIQFVTGVGTRLGQLAAMAWEAAGRRGQIVEVEGRGYDVSHFVGDPTRAREALGWSAGVTIERGVERMVKLWERARN